MHEYNNEINREDKTMETTKKTKSSSSKNDVKSFLNTINEAGAPEESGSKAGRPPKIGPIRDTSLSLKMTEYEKTQIKTLAGKAKMSITDFILKKCKIKME
mgnify:CR=1 FL=1